MAAKKIALILIALAVFGETRHTHPRAELWDDAPESRSGNVISDDSSPSAQLNHDGTETEVMKHKLKLPTPVSVLFFKSFDPCEEGFKQDYQGICREVWF